MKIAPLQTHKIEHSVEDAIRQRIIELGGYVIKNKANSESGKGKPDLSACLNGKYYGIEVKRSDTNVKTTLPQIHNLQQIAKAGGLAFHSKTPEMFGRLSQIHNVRKFYLNDVDLLLTINTILQTKGVVLVRVYPTYVVIYKVKKNS